MPTFPKIELPKFELPELPELPNVEDVASCARNAVYAGIGLAVTAVERVQALSTQLTDAVKESVAKVRPAA
jgi:hypothetical protein